MQHWLYDVSWVVPYRTPVLTQIFEAFTLIGYPQYIMLLLALLYWLWDKNASTRIAVLVILTTLVNAYLKDLFQNPRPDIAFALDPGVGNSYGMPSGHAQIAWVLWFGLAYEIAKRWAWVVATVLVAGICFSRIYLGVHDLEDVLSGSLIGLVTLLFYRSITGPRFDAFRQLNLTKHLVLLLGVSTVLYFTWPNEAYTIQALALSGFIAGWLIGVAIDQHALHFELKSPLWTKFGCVVIGMAGFVGLFAAINPIMEAVQSEFVTHVRTAIIGLYITLLAPLLFKLFRITAN